MKSIVFLFYLFSSILCAEGSSDESASMWFRIDVPQKAPVLLIAKEEAAYIKSQIGDWLPISILELKQPWVEIKMNRLRRKNNNLEYIFTIRNTLGITKQYKGSFFDFGDDKDLPCRLFVDQGVTYIEIECTFKQNGTEKIEKSTRRIMFRFSESKEDLEKSIRVSRAMAGFKWDYLTVEKF